MPNHSPLLPLPKHPLDTCASFKSEAIVSFLLSRGEQRTPREEDAMIRFLSASRLFTLNDPESGTPLITNEDGCHLALFTDHESIEHAKARVALYQQTVKEQQVSVRQLIEEHLPITEGVIIDPFSTVSFEVTWKRLERELGEIDRLTPQPPMSGCSPALVVSTVLDQSVSKDLKKFVSEAVGISDLYVAVGRHGMDGLILVLDCISSEFSDLSRKVTTILSQHVDKLPVDGSSLFIVQCNDPQELRHYERNGAIKFSRR